MKLTITKDKRGKYRWTLIARNGVKIGASSQGYRRKADCEKNIRQVADGLAEYLEGGRYANPIPVHDAKE